MLTVLMIVQNNYKVKPKLWTLTGSYSLIFLRNYTDVIWIIHHSLIVIAKVYP